MFMTAHWDISRLAADVYEGCIAAFGRSRRSPVNSEYEMNDISQSTTDIRLHKARRRTDRADGWTGKQEYGNTGNGWREHHKTLQTPKLWCALFVFQGEHTKLSFRNCGIMTAITYSTPFKYHSRDINTHCADCRVSEYQLDDAPAYNNAICVWEFARL